MLFFVDYILAYEINTDKDSEWQEKREEKRREFEANLEKAKLELEAEGIEVHIKFCLNVHGKGKAVFKVLRMSGLYPEFGIKKIEINIPLN